MELQVVQGRQNAAAYIGMLERSSLFADYFRLCAERWIFQQDNVAIHTARSSNDFFQPNNICLLDTSIVFTGIEPYRQPLGMDSKGRLQRWNVV